MSISILLVNLAFIIQALLSLRLDNDVEQEHKLKKKLLYSIEHSHILECELTNV